MFFFEKFPHTEGVDICLIVFFVSFLSLDFDFIHSSRDVGHIVVAQDSAPGF